MARRGAVAGLRVDEAAGDARTARVKVLAAEAMVLRLTVCESEKGWSREWPRSKRV